jgi:hypothetical protein
MQARHRHTAAKWSKAIHARRTDCEASLLRRAQTNGSQLMVTLAGLASTAKIVRSCSDQSRLNTTGWLESSPIV